MKLLWNNIDGGKPKYSQRNLSHDHTSISTTNLALTTLVLKSSPYDEKLKTHTGPVTQ